MTDSTRHKEFDRLPLRGQRIFCINGEWYFCSREGVAHGGYPSRQAAEAALSDLLRSQRTARTGPGSVSTTERKPDNHCPGQGFSFYW